MNSQIQNGTRNVIDGHQAIYYDGYWIRYYAPPEDNLTERMALIESLTKRAFHHTELGINTPGENLELARKAWEEETDPSRRRVNAAMLAGALFNRATDIFRILVELGRKGVRLSDDNELMRECGECFREALALGRNVRHYSGEEGIDEIWGEPFKAFTLPIASFYESRYLKVAHAMRDIDRVADGIIETIEGFPGMEPLEMQVREFANAARSECETMKSDPDNFHTWPRFVALSESVVGFRPPSAPYQTESMQHYLNEALRLVEEGKKVIEYLTGARVPMPKTMNNFLERVAQFKATQDTLKRASNR